MKVGLNAASASGGVGNSFDVEDFSAATALPEITCGVARGVGCLAVVSGCNWSETDSSIVDVASLFGRGCISTWRGDEDKFLDKTTRGGETEALMSNTNRIYKSIFFHLWKIFSWLRFYISETTHYTLFYLVTTSFEISRLWIKILGGRGREWGYGLLKEKQNNVCALHTTLLAK